MTVTNLVGEMQAEHTRWARSARVYGTTNALIRPVLIIASAVVAAQHNLTGTPAEFLVEWVPVIALIVSMLSGIDAWIKPRDRWRGFLEDRDKLGSLILEAQDTGASATLRTRFDDLRALHRDKHIL